jgi:acyl carrier protein
LSATREEVLACLADGLREAGIELGGRVLAPDLSLDHDLGVDSFQLMQVARHLETAYAFKFAVADWVLREEELDAPGYKVGGLVDFILAELSTQLPS